MTKRVQIEGSLSSESGDVFPVALSVTVAELYGQGGLEAENIASVELATRVPDGLYMLDYHYLKAFHRQVRVHYGAFVAP